MVYQSDLISCELWKINLNSYCPSIFQKPSHPLPAAGGRSHRPLLGHSTAIIKSQNFRFADSNKTATPGFGYMVGYMVFGLWSSDVWSFCLYFVIWSIVNQMLVLTSQLYQDKTVDHISETRCTLSKTFHKIEGIRYFQVKIQKIRQPRRVGDRGEETTSFSAFSAPHSSIRGPIR